SYDPSSWKSSNPPTIQILAFPSMTVSTPISRDSTAVAHAPTGVLIGPVEDKSNMLTQAAMVLLKDSCRLSFWTGLSIHLSLYIPLSAVIPPTPEPIQLPTSAR